MGKLPGNRPGLGIIEGRGGRAPRAGAGGGVGKPEGTVRAVGDTGGAGRPAGVGLAAAAAAAAAASGRVSFDAESN